MSYSLVRLIGLEPTRPESLDPKSSASTNFATDATIVFTYRLYIYLYYIYHICGKGNKIN